MKSLTSRGDKKMKIRHIVTTLFIIGFSLSDVSAQITGEIGAVLRPPVKRNPPFVVYTKGIEALPVGRGIIAELRKSSYATLQNNVNRKWNLRLKLSLDKSKIVVERGGLWKGVEFPLSQAGLHRTVIDIIKGEASWQAVKLLKNKNPNSKVKIEMRIIPEPGTEGAVLARMKKGNLHENDQFRVQVRNTGAVKAYITIIDLLADGKMKILCPTDRLDTNWVLPDGKWYTMPEGRSFYITLPVGAESLKVLATDKPIVLSSRYIAEEPPAKRRPPYDPLRQYFINLPNSSIQTPVNGNWATATLSFDAGEPRTLHVLSVGISKYDKGKAFKDFKDGTGNLEDLNAGDDVRDFSVLMEEYGRSVFDRLNVKVLYDKDATKKAITSAFREIIAQAKPQDTFVFQFSGRSVQVKNNQAIVPFDYDPRDILSSSIPTQFLQTYMSQIQASHQFVLIDGSVPANGAGNLIDRLKLENAEFAGLIQRDIWVLETGETNSDAAAGENKKRAGTLSSSIIKGMNGAADLNANGEITIAELFNYSEKFIKNKNELWKTGNDFVLLQNPLKEKVSYNFRSQPQFIPASFNYPGQEQQAREDQPEAENIKPEAAPTPTPEEPTVRAEIYGNPQKAQTDYVRKGKDYALLIGTNNYTNWRPLINPVSDIEAVAEQLEKKYGFEIDPKDILENPKRDDVITALGRIKERKYDPDDQLFIFIAGHGYYDEELNEGYLIFSDGSILSKTGMLCDSCGTYISHANLRIILNKTNCKHIFIVIDSCFSGTFNYDPATRRVNNRSTEVAINRDAKNAYKKLTSTQMIGRIMQFTARLSLTSGGKEYVLDGPPGEHSPFASSFLDALQSCGGKHGVLTFTDILSDVQWVDPMPRRGDWGDNDPDSNFIFECKKP
jgi:hypothetical protein